MWRWSSAHNAIQIWNMVFSTYVEVILDHDNRTSNSSCILHVCGGDPAFKVTSFSLILVFSTYVEVILKIYVVACQSLRILHVCGGDPLKPLDKWKAFWYSPRMWRWSQRKMKNDLSRYVFSTYVEVILEKASVFRVKNSILHVCGGDPELGLSSLNNMKYSPRMWRWSPIELILVIFIAVFSTYVEVILKFVTVVLWRDRILHVCGGDPYHLNHHPFQLQYSPHMWRWS